MQTTKKQTTVVLQKQLLFANTTKKSDVGQPLVQPHQEVARFDPNAGQLLMQPQQEVDRGPGSIYDLPLEEEPACAATPEQSHLMATLPDELAALKPSALRKWARAAGVPDTEVSGSWTSSRAIARGRPATDVHRLVSRDRLIALIVAAEVSQAPSDWLKWSSSVCDLAVGASASPDRI
jgi:hypothetical protein